MTVGRKSNTMIELDAVLSGHEGVTREKREL